ncbi:MAG: hypothetical protein U0R64_07475 [Candidatus Nanopelagicales bacterium]
MARITTRDQVEVEARLADRLGIDRFAAVIGGIHGRYARCWSGW